MDYMGEVIPFRRKEDKPPASNEVAEEISIEQLDSRIQEVKAELTKAHFDARRLRQDLQALMDYREQLLGPTEPGA